MRDIFSFFEKPKDPLSFSAIRISLASPEKIREWSHGEVKKPETINYRTFKPERDGLFCAKIFGPVKDYECNCGKYKRMKHRGIVCEKCGVEVIQSKVRRERLGHINLATPVAHIWFLKSLPSRIGNMLDISLKDLEKVLYCEAYIVIDPKETGLSRRPSCSREERYMQLVEEYGDDKFSAGMGGEAVLEMLKQVDVHTLERDAPPGDARGDERGEAEEDRQAPEGHRGVPREREPSRVDDAHGHPGAPAGSPPARPARRRPLRDERSQRSLSPRHQPQQPPEAPARAQRARDHHPQRAPHAPGGGRRPLRQRPPRQDDHRPEQAPAQVASATCSRASRGGSARTCSASASTTRAARSSSSARTLKLHQCGLPKQMALELFKPFIYNKLEERGYVNTIKSAKKMVEKERPEVWDILEEVISEHPVLLNRAPTLHRLGIQAFEPVLIEGKAIQLHPLVCAAFNADFDGDQMAVHVPLSVEAQMEARVLMMSTNNILSPANGKPIINPTQDIVLGLYYATRERKFSKGLLPRGDAHGRQEGARRGLPPRRLLVARRSPHGLRQRRGHAPLGHPRPRDRPRDEHPQASSTRRSGAASSPRSSPRVSRSTSSTRRSTRRRSRALIDACYRKHRNKATVLLADRLRSLGFDYATRAGVSICMDHMVIPQAKEVLLGEAQDEVQRVVDQYQEGLITDGERYNKIVDIWAGVADKVTQEMMSVIGKEKIVDPETGKEYIEPSFNPIYIMADSGARGSTQQIRQLAAMRGLMAKPSGEIIETPITANFREGLTRAPVLHLDARRAQGPRRHRAQDGELRVPHAAPRRRRAGRGHRASSTAGRSTASASRSSRTPAKSSSRSATASSAASRSKTSSTRSRARSSSPRNTELDEPSCTSIEDAGIEEVVIRSVLTCQTKRGVCAKCYGRDLARGYKVNIGEAVGIIASQSIGEPGTQLTMRTFHIGGAAARGKIEQSSLEARNEGFVRIRNANIAKKRGRHRQRHEPPRRGRHRRRHRPRARAPPPRVRRASSRSTRATR